jgi:O-antigen ligase
VVKGAGAVLALVWLLGLLRRRLAVQGLLGARVAFVLAAVAFVIWAAASAVWASSSGTALSATFRLVQGLLLTLMLVSCVRDRRAFRLVLGAFVIGATISAVLGLAGIAGATDASSATDVRIGGGLGDPNYLAAVIVPAIFIALAFHQTTSRRDLRWLLLGVMAVLVVSLLRTESRGGLLAIVVCAVIAIAFGGALRRKILITIGAIAVASVVYFAAFASAGSTHRVLDLGTSGSASSGRTELWGVALKAFRAHPLAGVGAGNFPVVEPVYATFTNANLTKPYLELDLGEVVHNTYLHVLAELGVVGIVLFLGALGVAVILGWRACRFSAREGNAEFETQLRGLFIGAIGMLVAFAFLTAQYEKQLWIVLGFLLIAHAIARTTAGRET